MHIGFTGTQRGMAPDQLARLTELLSDLGDCTGAQHGDCVGADAEFHAVCVGLGIPVHIHPPENEFKRAFCEIKRAGSIGPAKGYLNRNHDIVDACDLLFAAPPGFKRTGDPELGPQCVTKGTRGRRFGLLLQMEA